jgi:phosphoglycerate dehydrogenase-like enzyme
LVTDSLLGQSNSVVLTHMSERSTIVGIRAAFLDQYHPRIHSIIEQSLPEAWTSSFACSAKLSDQVETVTGADLLFVMAAPVTRDLIQASTSLRLIQKLGAGVDKIDHRACAERGIAIARLAGGNSIPVAEHTLLLMLAALRRLPVMDRRTRAGEWPKEEARGVGRQLHGKRVGLIGLGAVGKALVKLLKGFDVEIVYYDPVVAPNGGSKLPVRSVSLEELLSTSDVVSLHLPLSAETAGLISEERIRGMKPGAVLVNCARGGLVDETALARALSEGRLFAAGIDSFASEPPVSRELLDSDQVVVTPHIAGATLDNFTSVIQRAVRNASSFLSGGGISAEDAVFVPGHANLSAD